MDYIKETINYFEKKEIKKIIKIRETVIILTIYLGVLSLQNVLQLFNITIYKLYC